MGKPVKTGEEVTAAVDEVEEIMSKPRTERISIMKSHRLLQTCSKEKSDQLPKAGELVWAKVLGSVFWPGFIIHLKDLDTGAPPPDEIDDTAYGFVMFLEKHFRYAPVAWEQMIPFQQLDIQVRLFPDFNKLVVKKSWKMNGAYKLALKMAQEYSAMSIEQRQRSAELTFNTFKQANAVQKQNTSTTSKPATTPVKEEEVPPQEAISKVMLSVRQKKKSGIRVSDRITKKQIIKLKPKPVPKSSSSDKTEKSSSDASSSKKGGKAGKNQRPDKGGDVLKQWTHDRFSSFQKQFQFESANHRCTACSEEIDPEDGHKTCHGLAYHAKCLIKQGTENPTFKCAMCVAEECFICRKSTPKLSKDDKPSKEEITLKCSRCELRFHVNCLLKDWPQAEIQGSSGPITCPLHFCHTCLGEQKIYGKFRDYTTSSSRSYRCRLCLSTYHKNCLPAGCGDTMQGKETIICPKHTLPELKVNRRVGCLACCKQLKQKDEKIDCAYCVQSFHPKCVGYEDEITSRLSLADFALGYKCFSCKWGLFPLYGQVVWYQQIGHQYWPARILYPMEAKGRNNVAKRLPGQYSVEYFGTSLCFDNTSRALPLQLTTVEIFKTLKVYQDIPKILKAHEEAFFCNIFWDEHRTKLLPPPKPFYKKIERNVYRTVTVPKVREPTDVCPCSEEKSEFVCQADSGCTNRDMEMECSDKICKGGVRCKNRMFVERKNDEEFLEQKLFKNKGWGVVAKKEFKPGDFVAEYRGEFINKAEMLWRLSKKEEEDPLYIMEISKEYFIDAEYVGNLSRLINHSCDPNCEVRKYLSLGRSVGGIFARRPVAIGEELTFKYGCGNASTAAFRCRCGAKNCTVFVGKDVPDGFRVEDDPEFAQDKWEDVCNKCGYGGSLICCEYFTTTKEGDTANCGNVWHYKCAGISRKPRQNWCCSIHSEKEIATFLKKVELNKKSKLRKSQVTTSKNPSKKKAPPRQSAAPAAVQTDVKALEAHPQHAKDKPVNPGKRKLSATQSQLDPILAPALKKQRVNSSLGNSSEPPPRATNGQPEEVVKTNVFSPDIEPATEEAVRNLRSSKVTSPVKRALIFEPESPPVNSIADALVVLPKTLETPSSAPTKTVEGRRRRAHSIPPNGIRFCVPSTPNTRSKRFRRGESLHERTPNPADDLTSPPRVALPLKTSNITKLLNESKDVETESLIQEIPRMSRRRSRSSKTAEPFSPLALNQCVKPPDIQPINQSLLRTDEKPIRRGTRSSSISCLASASLNQIDTNGLDSSVKIKKEVVDTGFEKVVPFDMEMNNETPKKRKLRSPFNSSNVTPTGSPTARSQSHIPVKCEVTQTEEGINMVFRKPNPNHGVTKSWSSEKRSPRQYPGRLC